MKKHVSFLKLLLVLLAIICGTITFAQKSPSAMPPSFYFETENAILSSTENLSVNFDMAAIRAEDAERALNNLPPRTGKIISVNYTTDNSGEWTLLPNGQDIWRLCIVAKDAVAIMLLYDKFEIPAGGQLFIYNADRTQVLVYNEGENPQKTEYSTEFVAGDVMTLEYLAPTTTDYTTPVIISDVVYGYSHLLHVGNDRSGACEVNINCPEGDNWQNQKKGVVRVTIPIGGYTYLCSASMINNTAQDLTPYVLSAYHCFEGASQANLNQSRYYFHDEYNTCTGGGTPPIRSKIGADILVNIPINAGSDGTLLKLKQSIDTTWNVFYNGWDRRNIAATSGVSIHHPDGDKKKISTFTTSLISTNANMGGGVITAPNSGWRVTWQPTTTNHGVTEGGSSGSPIFNQDGRIVGTLTGGSSQCSSPYAPDIYGKLWYHWEQMSNPTLQMKPYLDPLGTGVEFLDGIYKIPEEPHTDTCFAAKNLTVTYTDDCEAVLTWEAVEQEQSDFTYAVFRDGVLITNTTDTEFVDNTSSYKDPHTWSVGVICPIGESERIDITGDGCRKTYTVSLSTNPEEGGIVIGTGEYLEDELVTIIATPNEFYNFLHWTINDSPYIIALDSIYSFFIFEDVAYVAHFELKPDGIKEIGQAKDFTLYPNPAGNQLNIVRTNVEKAQIVIYNNLGLRVQSQEITGATNRIDISALSSGVYFIRLTDNHNSGTQTFVKE